MSLVRCWKPTTGVPMVSSIDKGDNTMPTEEIYLELQELRSLAEERQDSVEPVQNPPTSQGIDEYNSIRDRIKRLRALLRDRGALDDSP